MSVRVGHIMRHEDVHGVSGIGKVAEVFEASNGKAVVVWLSSNTSVNVYENIKGIEANHGHGGKTSIVWDWEQEPDPDPMDKLTEKKEAESDGGDLDAATDKMAENIVKGALTKAAETLSGMAEGKAEERDKEESEPELPEKEPAKTPKKATIKKPAPKKAGNKKGTTK